jgi:hypothetical protein
MSHMPMTVAPIRAARSRRGRLVAAVLACIALAAVSGFIGGMMFSQSAHDYYIHSNAEMALPYIQASADPTATSDIPCDGKLVPVNTAISVLDTAQSQGAFDRLLASGALEHGWNYFCLRHDAKMLLDLHRANKPGRVDGTFYPKKSSLIVAQRKFDVGSVENCRVWARSMAARLGDPNMTRSDYECGIDFIEYKGAGARMYKDTVR